VTEIKHYEFGIPGLRRRALPGKLIVLEGTDGVGRSTQIALLLEWLEANGYAAVRTGLARSTLASKGIRQAKLGHTMGDLTLNLFYATDFADRIEKQIIPALRAGMVCLTDRYIYSMIARAVVRGVKESWIKSVLSFALVPDAVFYLRATTKDLLPRVIRAGGFDHWESGMDFLRLDDPYDSWIEYQTRLIGQIDAIAAEYNCTLIDASRSVDEVFFDLRDRIAELLVDMRPARLGKKGEVTRQILENSG
jgi:dTMP kinase